VVSAGGYADLVLGDLVNEAMLVGDAAGPVALEAVLERLGLADPFVSANCLTYRKLYVTRLAGTSDPSCR
jgi:hypothetical protein